MKFEYDEIIMWLDIDSWVGYSLGAKHYYGKVQYVNRDGKKVCKELLKILTEKDCKQFEGTDSSYIWRPGDEYPGFDTKEELILFAIEYLKEYCPEKKLILQGSGSSASVSQVLYGPYMKEINELYEMNEKYCYSSHYDAEMDELDQLYYKILDIIVKSRRNL